MTNSSTQEIHTFSVTRKPKRSKKVPRLGGASPHRPSNTRALRFSPPKQRETIEGPNRYNLSNDDIIV